MKKKLLSIRVFNRYGGNGFEDVMAEEIGNGLAIAKSEFFHRWTIFDVASGLFVLTNYGSKKKALEELDKKIQEGFLDRIEKGRKALSYQGRCLEMERHSMYR